MKILKQLSKIILKTTLFLFLYNYSFANEPIDIWKIEKKDDNNKDSSIADLKESNNLNINTALSNSFGFGGTNAALIFEKV